MASMFVDIAGEWKLGGVEYIKPVDPPANSEATPELTRLPHLQVYDPPEGRKYSKGHKRIEKWYVRIAGFSRRWQELAKCCVLFYDKLPTNNSLTNCIDSTTL